MLGQAVRVKSSGRIGRIVLTDVGDELPYKVSFGSSAPPDWLKEEAIELVADDEVLTVSELPAVDPQQAAVEARRLAEAKQAVQRNATADNRDSPRDASDVDIDLPGDDFDAGCYSNGYWVEGALAPWLPTDSARAREALTAAALHAGDLLLELGCGDGKICRAAAELFGCRALGVELDPKMVSRSQENIGQMPESCRSLVEIRQGDVLNMELAESPTCVTMFLMPQQYKKLETLLERLVDNGARLVVFGWRLKGRRWSERLAQQGSEWFLYRTASHTGGRS